jgi:prepilin peptidase CpaA
MAVAPWLLPAAVLVAMLALACREDLRARRIPNAVAVAGAVAGAFWHAAGPAGAWAFDPVAPGAVGLAGSLAACAGMLAALLPLYRWRLLGGGDVKLLAAVAAVYGGSLDRWTHLVGLLLSVAVAGGVLALVRMADPRRARRVLVHLGALAAGGAARLRGGAGSGFDARRDSADRLPYALAIAAGTVLHLGLTWTGTITTS